MYTLLHQCNSWIVVFMSTYFSNANPACIPGILIDSERYCACRAFYCGGIFDQKTLKRTIFKAKCTKRSFFFFLFAIIICILTISVPKYMVCIVFYTHNMLPSAKVRYMDKYMLFENWCEIDYTYEKLIAIILIDNNYNFNTAPWMEVLWLMFTPPRTTKQYIT